MGYLEEGDWWRVCWQRWKLIRRKCRGLYTTNGDKEVIEPQEWLVLQLERKELAGSGQDSNCS